MTGTAAIENRANQLLADAEEEIVLVVGDERLLTEALVDTLNESRRDVDVIVGAITEELQASVEDSVPDATTFLSGLEWLHSGDTRDQAVVGRLLLVDRSSLLGSTLIPATGEEHAVFGRGFGNSLVIIARRIMAHGLFNDRDPREGSSS